MAENDSKNSKKPVTKKKVPTKNSKKTKTLLPSQDQKKNSKKEKKAEDSKNNLLTFEKLFPTQLPIIAVHSRPLFPNMVIPLVISDELFIKAIEKANNESPSYIGVVLAKPTFSVNNPDIKDLYSVGVLGRITKIFSQDQQDQDDLQILLDVQGRIQITSAISYAPAMICNVDHILEQEVKINDVIRAYSREILSNMKELVRLNPLFKEELSHLINQINIDDPNRLSDFAATLTSADKEDLQKVLETVKITTRLEKTLLLIKNELDISRLQAKISKQIENRISEHQREFFLREQLKEIRKELGMTKDERSQDLDKLLKRAQKLKFSPEAKEKFDEEYNKLALLDIQSSEFNVVRNYLDWITLLPWGIYVKDNLNLQRAKKILEKDHYGLEDIKERVLELISVMKLKKTTSGTIICFVGPPGVGKTSIGRSIAAALNRKFYNFSLGGMRDEAEIKGHRRTYIGAMPGKFIQALKITKQANPVIMLDEIDKVGNSYHGDPASALLEALDPEQNKYFNDHFLDVPFDLSKIIFITTANQLDTIPAPLLDRMEILRLSGYIKEEKVEIAKKYLIPKQIQEHGLDPKKITIETSAINAIIDGYAREAGVRNLEKNIVKICRKVASQIVDQNIPDKKFFIKKNDLKKYLKNPVFIDDEIIGEGKSGVVTGLAWTSMGGAILSIEAIKMASEKKGFKQSGQLGEIMVESSEIAYSYVLANAEQFKGKADFFEKNFIHLHVPAGATPKDGPSAGITMTTALISLMLNKPVPLKLAMTGELTLTGEVLAIGGLKEKIIAARRANIKTVIIPKANQKDYLELPDHLKENLTHHFVEKYTEVFQIVF